MHCRSLVVSLSLALRPITPPLITLLTLADLILYRVGPRAWISLQIFAWGLVATFQAFQKGVGAYMATRLLLGYASSSE